MRLKQHECRLILGLKICKATETRRKAQAEHAKTKGLNKREKLQQQEKETE